jgi:hypothetical protein
MLSNHSVEGMAVDDGSWFSSRSVPLGPMLRHPRRPAIAKVACARNGTYTGDPPSGLTTRGTFLGWKSNQEVRCAVVSGVRVFDRL